MGHSFPNLEEDKNNPPPKSPPTLPEKHSEEGEYDIKFVRGKKKPRNPPSADFFAGEPE